jgi:hypothetical protein
MTDEEKIRLNELMKTYGFHDVFNSRLLHDLITINYN